MQKRRFYRMIVSWGLVFGWMGIIFYLSAQHAEQSANLSGGITDTVKVLVDRVAPNSNVNIESVSIFVRKNAHFFAYLLLGMLSLNALRKSRVENRKSLVLAFAISVLYAISDEVHQLFVPGRSGQVSDVLLDSTGALVGIVLYAVISRWSGRKRQTEETNIKV